MPTKSDSVTQQDVFERPVAGVALGFVLFLTTHATVFGADPRVAPASAWPMARGSQSLAGVSNSRLPEKLSLLWTFKTEGPVKSSPAIVDGRVYFGSNDGNVYAVHLETGKKIWAYQTGDPVEAAPLVLDQKVFIGSTDGYLYALDATNGQEVWKHQTEAKIVSGANWVAAAKPNDPPWILAGSHDYKLYCLDSATGREIWNYETGNYINGSTAVADGQTVFGGCDAMVHVLSLADGKKTGEVEIGAPIIGSGALDNGRLYLGHYENEFVCVDLKATNRVWTFRDRPFSYVSSPAVTRDHVIFGGQDRKVHCVSKSDGQEIWSFQTRGKVDGSPVVCGDKVVVGSFDGRLYLLSLAGGKELWSFEIGQPLASSPAVADGKVVIGSDDGNVYCFGATQ